MKKNIFLTLILFVSCLGAFAGDIYVSPAGNDSHDGTKERPLKTIQRALRMAREWRRSNDTRSIGEVRILLQSGAVFELDEPLYIRPEDSGTPSSKTVFTTTSDVKAYISGARRVDNGHSSQNSYPAPRIAGKPILTSSLWCADHKFSCASHVANGEMERILDFDVKTETITIPAKSLTRYGITHISDAPQLEMVLHQRWAIAILRVREIDIKGDRAVLSFYNPESRWEFSHPWPQPLVEGERGASSFYLRNARQFLDSESKEWWQDYSTGRIYLTRQSQEVFIPYLNRLVTVEGILGDKVHDIIFRNIGFVYSAWERPAHFGHVTLQGGFPIIDAYKLTENEGTPWASSLENQAWIARPEAAVSINNAERVDFYGCDFCHLASTAIDYVSGCKDIKICDNTFSDIGGTAILAGSFLEGATEVHRPYGMLLTTERNTLLREEEYTSNFFIEGNTINDATNEDWGAVAIGCGFVRDFTIRKNHVSHINYSGISVGWGWTAADTGMRNNRILDNHVEDYARQLYDAGGIYTMSNQPNSLISGNTVTAPHAAPYATNYRAFPIYFDACTNGYTVKDNNLQTTEMLREKYGYNTPGADMEVEK